MKKTLLLILIISSLLISCSSDKGKKKYPSESDSTKISYVEETPVKPDEFSIFNGMIDSIYPEIRKMKFDTIDTKAILSVEDFQKHRIISIILSKNQNNDCQLGRISGLYSCICKHESIKKKDSQDLVIEEYLFENPKDASFWFDQLYNCYYEGNNPKGEPLKEPYKIWQSSNRIIHLYTRAEMWREAMDSINKAMMKRFVFSTKKNE